MKIQQAKRCAEKIAGQILADNIDRVGGMAEELVKQNPYAIKEVSVSLITDQYREVIKRLAKRR